MGSMVLLALVAGCGGNTHVGGISTTTSSSPYATTTSPGSTTTIPTSTISRCHTKDLSASLGVGGVAAGNVGVPLHLANISHASCTVYGYVGMQLDDNMRHFLRTDTVRGPSMEYWDPGPTLITLNPGQVASAGVGYTDNPEEPQDPASGCPQSSYLEVTPPDETTYLFIPAHLAPCGAGRLDVTALEPGSQLLGPGAPLLGRTGAYPNSVGFGMTEPPSVFLGGEAESAVTQIIWSGWGYTQATGSGTGCYYGGTQTAADCTHEQVTLFAFDLGPCGGALSYQRLEYVFDKEGETFDPDSALNICTGG